MLVDADGTNHGYTGNLSNYASGNYSSTSFNGYTTDGTFIDYSCYVSTYNGVTSMSAFATLPNGTNITYSVYSERKGGGNVNHSAHLCGAAYGVVFTLLVEPRAFAAFFSALVQPRFG